MTLDEAGRLQEAWKIKNGHKVCHHARIVDSLVTKTGRRKGKLVCRECGAVIPDAGQEISHKQKRIIV
jgi:hypothetical protein